MIIDVPAFTPVTRPLNEPTLALALLLVHVPPNTIPSLKLVADPLHTVNVPNIEGKVLTTVMVVLVLQPPGKI